MMLSSSTRPRNGFALAWSAVLLVLFASLKRGQARLDEAHLEGSLLRGGSILASNRDLFDLPSPFDFNSDACLAKCTGTDDEELTPFLNACPKCPDRYSKEHCNHCCLDGASSLKLRWHGCPPGDFSFASISDMSEDCNVDTDDYDAFATPRFVDCECYDAIASTESFSPVGCDTFSVWDVTPSNASYFDICIVSVSTTGEMDFSQALSPVVGIIHSSPDTDDDTHPYIFKNDTTDWNMYPMTTYFDTTCKIINGADFVLPIFPGFGKFPNSCANESFIDLEEHGNPRLPSEIDHHDGAPPEEAFWFEFMDGTSTSFWPSDGTDLEHHSFDPTFAVCSCTDCQSRNPSGPPSVSPLPSPTRSPAIDPTKEPSMSPTGKPTPSPSGDTPSVPPFPSPTHSPALDPTEEPSVSPTGKTTTSPSGETPSVSPLPSPTHSPALDPTKEPSVSPTGKPTPSGGTPSVSPSPSPTHAPAEPSIRPVTPKPSRRPTIGTSSPPTMLPTPPQSPTVSATEIPTALPTFSPTAAPTETQEDPPTESPSNQPHQPSHPPVFPTERPSSKPSNMASPTMTPTTTPTEYPTFSPTALPTALPTFSPTAAPTESPSNQPHQPSHPPIFPTERPSSKPSNVPTASPTMTPTTTPTEYPTFGPTALPTALPTFSPTKAPTEYPTFSPTALPTALPTFSPTTTPTEYPTFSPTALPTALPTFSPTTTPTEYPTFSPTVIPTSQPHQRPSSKPSHAPSTGPTTQPTYCGPHEPTLPKTPTQIPSQEPSTAPSECEDRHYAECNTFALLHCRTKADDDFCFFPGTRKLQALQSFLSQLGSLSSVEEAFQGDEIISKEAILTEIGSHKARRSMLQLGSESG